MTNTKRTTATGSKSADQYIINAAMELFPTELVLTKENLSNWMIENMNQIAKRASEIQSKMLNKFFGSEKMQDEAKLVLMPKIHSLLS
jgi:hypothetical protein